MKIIVPCGGSSSRYPNMPPKWMLPDQDGVPMVFRAVERLDFDPAELVITILAEHEHAYDVTHGLARVFGAKVKTVILDAPTRSQSETVAETIKQLNLNEPFLVKDSDNCFSIDGVDYPTNYVTVSSLNNFDLINPRNKSYVSIDHEDFVTSIREKRVISDLFSVGGYFFREPASFLSAFERMSDDPGVGVEEIYISEIISYLLLSGENFKVRRAEKYEDWGTVHEWRRKLESRNLFFVNIDGFLFERGSLHFKPSFDKARPNPLAVEAVRHLVQVGHRVAYLSIRPQELEPITKQALSDLHLPEGPIMMGCDLAQWTIVTAPHPTLPFNTSRAREIAPDDENIIEKLGAWE